MKGSEEGSHGAAWRADRRPVTPGTHRSAGLAALIAAAAIGLAACGSGQSPQHVASLAESGAPGGANGSGSSGTTTSSATEVKGNPTALLDEWATCMHSHGDPNQTDPTIDAYGVINISIVGMSQAAEELSNAVHSGTDPCNQYVAEAQSALRAAHPVAAPPDQAEGLKYVSCMRANGVPSYPYSQGGKTDFNGTGVDPNSPFVQNVNKLCGKKLGLPAWWINGTGPPGDVTVSSGPNGGPPPNGGGNAGPRTVTRGNPGAGGNAGSGTGG